MLADRPDRRLAQSAVTPLAATVAAVDAGAVAVAVRHRDARLVAALTLLRDRLAGVVDELLARELDEQDRAELARALRTIAQDLAPALVVPGEVDGSSPQSGSPCAAGG